MTITTAPATEATAYAAASAECENNWLATGNTAANRFLAFRLACNLSADGYTDAAARLLRNWG